MAFPCPCAISKYSINQEVAYYNIMKLVVFSNISIIIAIKTIKIFETIFGLFCVFLFHSAPPHLPSLPHFTFYVTLSLVGQLEMNRKCLLISMFVFFFFSFLFFSIEQHWSLRDFKGSEISTREKSSSVLFSWLKIPFEGNRFIFFYEICNT